MLEPENNVLRGKNRADYTRDGSLRGIDVLVISECRWSFGRLRTQTGETIIYSGRDDDIHQSGVAIVMSKKASQCLDSWIAISDRIIKARFYSRFIKTTIIQVYAPTNEAEDKEDDFYELQKIVDEVPRHDMFLVVGDWNAKVGEKQVEEKGIVGTFGMAGERSENGELVSFCALNNLAIASTMFRIRPFIGTRGLLQMASTTTKSIIWLFAEMLNDQFKMLEQTARATIIW